MKPPRPTVRNPIVAALTLATLFTTAAEGLAAQPQPAPETAPYNLATPPACFTAKGEPVKHMFFPADVFAKSGGFLAVATRLKDGNRTPAIFIDEDSMKLYPPEMQNHLLLHECAHHRNGDLDLDRISLSPAALQKIEDRADCTALQRLRAENSYGDKEFRIIGRSLSSLMKEAGYPGGAIRARMAALHACIFKPSP